MDVHDSEVPNMQPRRIHLLERREVPRASRVVLRQAEKQPSAFLQRSDNLSWHERTVRHVFEDVVHGYRVVSRPGQPVPPVSRATAQTSCVTDADTWTRNCLTRRPPCHAERTTPPGSLRG